MKVTCSTGGLLRNYFANLNRESNPFHSFPEQIQEAYKGEIQCPFLPNQICFLTNHNKFHAADKKLLLLTSVRRRTLFGQQQHTICTQLGTLFSGPKYLDNRSLETFDVTGYQCKWNSKNVKSEIVGRIVFLEDCDQLYFEMQACVVGTSRTQRSKRNL